MAQDKMQNKGNTPKERPSTLEQSVAMKPIAWLLIAGAVGFVVYKGGKGVSEAFKKWQANRDLEKEKEPPPLVAIEPLHHMKQDLTDAV